MNGRATTRGVTIAALMTALGRPTWWILALAGFLVRGGIVPFAIAVVTAPSPLALSNVLAPIVTPLYLGRLEPGTAALLVSAITAVLTWLVAGSWFAAATEVVLVRDARATAADDGLPTVPGGGRPGRLLISRAAMAHLVALLPFAAVLGVGAAMIVGVSYTELVNPSDSGPVVPRVVAGSVGPIVAIVVTWWLGETVGGLAARRVVLRDEPVLRAVAASAGDLVRRPVGSLVAPLLTTAILALDLVAVLLVVAIVWTDVRDRLAEPGGDVVATALALATFGGAWCLALLVTGLIASWRSVAMTFESERADVARGAAALVDRGLTGDVAA